MHIMSLIKMEIRSTKAELIDSANVQATERLKNVKELGLMNKMLNTDKPALSVLKDITRNKEKQFHLVDIGCGGGESIRFFALWARRNQVDFKFTGIDNSQPIIEYFKLQSKSYANIEGVNADYNHFLENSNHVIDIIYCSLFCHHLMDEQIIELMRLANKRKAWLIINDLQRTKGAYISSYLLTRLLNGTSLAKHDGPLSVLKGFKLNELRSLAQKAGINNYTLSLSPFFRILMVLKPNNDNNSI